MPLGRVPLASMLFRLLPEMEMIKLFSRMKALAGVPAIPRDAFHAPRTKGFGENTIQGTGKAPCLQEAYDLLWKHLNNDAERRIIKPLIVFLAVWTTGDHVDLGTVLSLPRIPFPPG